MAHGDNLLARLTRATGSSTAGAVLFRLLYWVDKVGCELEGQKWVPNSDREWGEEVGVTTKKARVAVKLVEAAHLVESRIAIYRGRKTLHLRPTQRAQAIAKGISEAEIEVSHCPGGQGTSTSGSTYLDLEGKVHHPGGQGIIQGGIQGEIKEENIGEPLSSQNLIDPETGKDSGMGNMDEQLKLAKEKTNKKIQKPGTLSSLLSIWKKTVSANTGQMVVMLKKDEMNLNHFRKLVPAGQAEVILEKVLADWVGFAKRAESLAGAFNLPSQPQVWFLLKHANVAVGFAKPTVQAIATPKPKTVNTPKAYSVQALQSIAPGDDDDPEISYEETVALLKGKKNG